MARGQKGSLPALGSTQPWGGVSSTRAREYVAATTKWPTKCHLCGKRVDKTERWHLEHKEPQSLRPDLVWSPDNWGVSHARCSSKSGQSVVIAKAREEGRREALGSPRAAGPADFPRTEGVPEPPPLLLHESESEPPAIEPNEALMWSSHDLRAYAWLKDLADVPEDAAPPLYMTPVPPAAVCSYAWKGCPHVPGGEPAEPWIEREQKISMRHWQKLSLRRQLEHDAEGSLVWRKKIESAPRRAGKSVGLRGGALWRMEHGEALFGELQNVMHTGSDIPICREIQRYAWAWAEKRGWNVQRKNGGETIETVKDGGSRWMVRSQEGVYGYDVHLGMGDECWNVKPSTISEGLEPATLERVSPQVVLTSTAHRRATSLMRTELANALAITDPDVLLLLWGALVTDDPGDPAVWRAASPYWSADRAKMIKAKYAAALAGEDAPEFDDPDPMRGFQAQYLNVWTITEKRLIGSPVIEEDDWRALAGVPQETPPDAVAVEAWFERGVSVAQAWRGQDGTVTVSVSDHPTLDLAARQIAALQLRRPAIVGASLVDHPAWKRHKVRTESASASTISQVGELQRVLRESTLRHDGSAPLSEQVLALRVSPGVNGPRIRSTERADAIKSAMWAASAAASAVRRKVIVPTRYQSA